MGHREAAASLSVSLRCCQASGIPVEKVTDSFRHALKEGDTYQVAFQKDEEVDLSGQAGDRNNEWIRIIYYTQDSKITMIQIADTNFLQFFK